MKIGILGAGISGLSFAKLAQSDFEVEVLERHQAHGGIARTRSIEGITYHTTGGHCFNSRYPEVMDFVFKQVLPEESWHQIRRRAVIRFRGKTVSYPIEYAVRQIYQMDQSLAQDIVTDLLSADDDSDYLNLEDWFRKKFGNRLAEEYFIPYNTKIWKRRPAEMNHSWVEDKLPVPDKAAFFRSLLAEESDQMPHSSFYYPNTNDQNTFIDHLAAGLPIIYDYEVFRIAYIAATRKWVINGEREYDVLVSTLPLNLLPGLFTGTPAWLLEQARRLSYNKVTTMLWESAETTETWTYIPDPDILFHRYIHIGNFFSPQKNYTITEAVGEISYELMAAHGSNDPFLIRPVDYHVSDHAYVVFDEHYHQATSAIASYFREIQLYTLGRFGEWQYYNMDVCIKKSMELCDLIRKKK